MPGMNWPVVAYAPTPATMPNIAIKPLKRSAPEFMSINKNNINYVDQLNEKGNTEQVSTFQKSKQTK